MPCIDLSFRGIPYTEFRTSGNFVKGETNETTRIYISDWDVALPLAQALVGRHVDSGGVQSFQPPQRDPNQTFLRALSVQVEGLGMIGQDALGAIAYDKARLTVTFGQKENDQTDDGDVTFLTERRSPASKAITIPEEFLIYAEGVNNGDVIGDGAVNVIKKPLKILTYDIAFWFNAPTFLEQFEGDTNDAAITILDTTWPKETLRFDYSARTRQFTSDGLEAWQVTLQLTFNKEGWNTVFSPDDGRFVKYEVKTGDKVHKLTNFIQLFPVGLVI